MAEASKKRNPRAEGARRYGPALEKAYQFVLWLIPAVEKFPRGPDMYARALQGNSG